MDINNIQYLHNQLNNTIVYVITSVPTKKFVWTSFKVLLTPVVVS